MIENKEIEDIGKDGCEIISSMQGNARKGKKIERYCVYTIIATAWALSYKTGTLIYNVQIKVSLILGILWGFLDIFYYLATAIFYKYILTKYFEEKKEGNTVFVYKHDFFKEKVNILTEKMLNLQVYYSIGLAIIMLISAFFMGLAVVHLPVAY